jgi:hypothetical protein
MPDWLYVRPEAVLFAAAAGLYLHDVAIRLFANEVVICRSGRGAWLAKTAARYPEFGRRYLAVVRPWRPDTTVLRAAWPRAVDSDTSGSRPLPEAIADVEKRLRFLRFQCPPLLFTLFIGLPCAQAFYGATALLIGIAVVYLQAFVMAGWLVAKRSRLGLPWRSIGFVLFESLVCVPYAINLYRKIADRLVPVDADPIDLASALLEPQDAAALRREIVKAIDERMTMANADGAKQERLLTYRDRLLEQGAA